MGLRNDSGMVVNKWGDNYTGMSMGVSGNGREDGKY